MLFNFLGVGLIKPLKKIGVDTEAAEREIYYIHRKTRDKSNFLNLGF
jgi:hypothetical protein